MGDVSLVFFRFFAATLPTSGECLQRPALAVLGLGSGGLAAVILATVSTA
jgi:hypothetical protein